MHYPRRGEVLGCDFEGLKEPEIIKERPVVIFSVSQARPNLAIVVPLSTTPPDTIQPWHHKLELVWETAESAGPSATCSMPCRTGDSPRGVWERLRMAAANT
jgi:uncharacterized protein YifN (PemK superfamily)